MREDDFGGRFPYDEGMTKYLGSRFGTDYSDPGSYSGTGLEDTRRRTPAIHAPGGMVLRTVGAVFLAVVALVVAWHLLGFVIGTVFFAVKLALLVGVVALIVAAFRRFR